MENKMIIMPVIALRGITILPNMIVHFDVSRTKSVNALEKAMITDQKVFLVTQKDGEGDDPSFDDLYKVGTIAIVKQLIKLPNNIIRVLIEGKRRG
ncbi:MAG: endopeptidase La, partial [Clostridiales bacterium]|nr:endopeptidase La [Clostridiales bacterium]